jgi:SAM-dependent methyltransferase
MNDDREHHEAVDEERICFFELKDVEIEDFDAEGFVLDVGGGGEGVIGKLKGAQVVAIDRQREELQETAPGPLKIVMDATDLQFLNESFATATAFFTLMYIDPGDLQAVLDEVFRVLEPGGRFLIWDVIIPPRGDAEQDIAAYPFRFVLPGETIETGYGVRWPEDGRALSAYVRLAEAAGFTVETHHKDEHVFYLELVKRDA